MPLDWTHGDLLEGLRCFHSGAFFEAHEHWESVWLAAQEPEKTFLQGLIQVAASFHHFQRGNCAGTISLLRSSLRRLDGYPEVFAGIAVAPLRVALRNFNHDWDGLACRRKTGHLELRMEFFQLHHPPDVTVLCDRKGCEQVADYLEVDDHGHEYRVCAMHTDSKTHVSRLPTRKPSPDLPFLSRPAA